MFSEPVDLIYHQPGSTNRESRKGGMVELAIKINTKKKSTATKRKATSTTRNSKRGKAASTAKRGRPKGSTNKKKSTGAGGPRGPRINCTEAVLKKHLKIVEKLGVEKKELDEDQVQLAIDIYDALKAGRKDGVPVALMAEELGITPTYAHVMISNGKPSGRRPGRPKGS